MMTGGDLELQLELIGIFREQCEIWDRLLTPDSPVDTWRDAAHSVKGSARGLGLWALAELSDEVEALGRAGVFEHKGVSLALERVRRALRTSLAELETLTLQGAA
jgi:HPt (histidine-containing phosphotransfer) domain-containing protein